MLPVVKLRSREGGRLARTTLERGEDSGRVPSHRPKEASHSAQSYQATLGESFHISEAQNLPLTKGIRIVSNLWNL